MCVCGQLTLNLNSLVMVEARAIMAIISLANKLGLRKQNPNTI